MALIQCGNQGKLELQNWRQESRRKTKQYQCWLNSTSDRLSLEEITTSRQNKEDKSIVKYKLQKNSENQSNDFLYLGYEGKTQTSSKLDGPVLQRESVCGPILLWDFLLHLVSRFFYTLYKYMVNNH